MSDRPNILLITTDQQRGDCLGIDGHPVLQTPNLDYLARSGARFSRAYSECPSCVPARRTLMSGMAPAAHGMVGYTSAPWEPAHTLAGELSKAGYQTEMIGKLHFHPPRKRFGFDHMELADTAYGSENDYEQWLTRQGHAPIRPGVAHGVSSNAWVGRPTLLPEQQTHSFWCIDRAMRFLQRRDPSCPFFLNISFTDPHPPLTPPALYYDRYVGLDLPEPVVGDWARHFDGPQRGLNPNAHRICLDPYAMRCCRAGYFGLINFVDDQIGRLMHFASREMKNTFVLFTSDHGEMLGDHHLFRKTFPYEASARVPFLARAPKSMGLPDGHIIDRPVGLQDVMPTLLEVAGVPVPPTCTGRSVLPLLRGDTDLWRPHLHGEHSPCYAPDAGYHFLVDSRRKYIWNSATGQEQLFDIGQDPNEMHDLATKPGAEADLAQWRKRLIDVLRDRPEGATDGDRLIAGRSGSALIPGYEPDKHYPFL